jgi:hypothetical protein
MLLLAGWNSVRHHVGWLVVGCGSRLGILRLKVALSSYLVLLMNGSKGLLLAQMCRQGVFRGLLNLFLHLALWLLIEVARVVHRLLKLLLSITLRSRRILMSVDLLIVC